MISLQHEIQCFLQKLKSFGGQAVNIRESLSISIANNILLMILGKRFDYGDDKFVHIKRTMDDVVARTSAISPLMFFPWLKYIPIVRSHAKFDYLR